MILLLLKISTIKIIERSYKSEKEIKDKLLKKEFDNKTVNRTLSFLKEYISDITPSLMYEYTDKSVLLNQLQKYDPLLVRSEQADEDAISYYEKALDHSDCSDDIKQEIQFNVIVCYEKLEDWDNAKAKLEDYVTAYPDDEKAAKEAEFLKTR